MPFILVTGATGNQGGATIQHLVEYNETAAEPFGILALTRDVESRQAQALSALPGVELIQGSLDDLVSLEKALAKYANELYGVFSIQVAFQTNEVQQGTGLADLAVKLGVKRFAYTSVDMSGLNPHPLPFFDSKRQIEEHISVTFPSSISWTVLRPSSFYENLYIPMYPEALLSLLDGDVVWPMIALSDIGHAAVEVLTSPNKENEARFKSKIINLTADRAAIHDKFEILKEKGAVWKSETSEEWQSRAQSILGPAVSFLEAGFKIAAQYPMEGTLEDAKGLFSFEFKTFADWVKEDYRA